MGVCEFKASLVYKVDSRTGSKATQRNPVSKNEKSLYTYIYIYEILKKENSGDTSDMRLSQKFNPGNTVVAADGEAA